MIRVVHTLLMEPDIKERWHQGIRDMWLSDVKEFALILTLALCLLAFAVVLFVVTRILEKKNDYGDEDEMNMRAGDDAMPSTIQARIGTDLASGSINCMKHFRYEDITKR